MSGHGVLSVHVSSRFKSAGGKRAVEVPFPERLDATILHAVLPSHSNKLQIYRGKSNQVSHNRFTLRTDATMDITFP